MLKSENHPTSVIDKAVVAVVAKARLHKARRIYLVPTPQPLKP